MANNIQITSGAGTLIATDDAGGAQYQLVKLVDGTEDSTARIPGSAATGLLVNTELPAAATLADAAANPTVPLVGAPALLFNGTTWDRMRSNHELTVLASAARTALASSPVQTNYNARGAAAFLRITAASGTGGLRLRFIGMNGSGGGGIINLDPTPVTTVGSHIYFLYPGIATVGLQVAQVTSSILPWRWRIDVQVGDASSYTYEVLVQPIV